MGRVFSILNYLFYVIPIRESDNTTEIECSGHMPKYDKGKEKSTKMWHLSDNKYGKILTVYY